MKEPQHCFYNFRDLGGYRLKNGGTTLHGAFARSNIIKSIDQPELDQLKEQGFTTFVDLRTPEELVKHPHALANNPDFKYVNCPMDKWWRSDFYTAEESAMYYIMLLLFSDNVRTILTTLADAPQGAVFNCYAGKDRTGTTAALLLLIAGVCDEDIIADYHKTYAARWGDTPREELLMVRPLIPVPENMEMLLAMFRARWGTVENYCYSIHLPEEKVLTIRRKLTGSEH